MQYFGADGLGSVRQIYDASAQVIGSSRYDPYGNVMSQSGATSVFAFTGEQYDAATGLEYLRARYYSAAQGRFVTRDVWEGDPNAPMSYNAWLYAYANAVNLMDPSGQQPVSSQVLLSLVSGVMPGLNISFGTNLGKLLADLLDACVLDHMPPGIGPAIPNGQSSSGSNAGAPPPAMPIPPPTGAGSITKAQLADLARLADVDSITPVPFVPSYALTSMVGAFAAVGEGNVYCPLERVKESDPDPASCGAAFKALLLTVRNRFNANVAAIQDRRIQHYLYATLDNVNSDARIMTYGCDRGNCSAYQGLNSWEERPHTFNLELPKIARQFRIAFQSALAVFQGGYTNSKVGKSTYFGSQAVASPYCPTPAPGQQSKCYSSNFGATGKDPTFFWGQ